MLPLLSLFVFLLALIGIIISVINTWRKEKNPSPKLKKWIYIPLFLSLISLIINRYVNSEISELSNRKVENLKKELSGTRDELKTTRKSLDSTIREQDSIKRGNEELKADHNITKEKLSTTQEKLAFRIITNKQREKFISSLSNKPKESIWVYFFMGNTESSEYAQQILNMLVSSGFKCDNVRPIMYSAPVTDIILRIKDLKFTPIAENIVEAFKLINVEVKRELQPKLDTNFELFVGLKPA